MTPTETAEKPAATAEEPRPAAQVPHDELYDATMRLLEATNTVLRDVDKNSADLHRDAEWLRSAARAANDLLFPPPLPDSPEDATVLYGHALRDRDLLWVNGTGWSEVVAIYPPNTTGLFNVSLAHGPDRVRTNSREPTRSAYVHRELRLDDVYAVQRKTSKDAAAAEGAVE